MIGKDGNDSPPFDVDDVERNIGRAIRDFRIDAGYSQDEVALRTGLSRSAVQSLESGGGSRLATMIRTLRVLDRLDVLDELVPRSEPTPMELLAERRRRRPHAARRVRRRD